MAPPAPGRLSATNGWPSCCCSFSATTRAAMSVACPGGQGTTILTGRLGYACAHAAPATTKEIKHAVKRFIPGALLSFDSDVRVPDDFAVAILLPAHVRGHFLGRARDRVKPDADHALLELVACQRLADVSGKARTEPARRSRRAG